MRKELPELSVDELLELQQLAWWDVNTFERYKLRRLYGEPMAYIRWRKEFPYWEDGDIVRIAMDPRAYVSNLESIHLVQTVADVIPERGSVLEVGVGSWCLSILLSKLRDDLARHDASDLSPHALKLAHENITYHWCTISLYESDVCRDLNIDEPDVIMADMPYGYGEETNAPTSNMSDFVHMPACALYDFRWNIASYVEIIKSAQAKWWRSKCYFEIWPMWTKELQPEMPDNATWNIIEIITGAYRILNVEL